MGEEEQLAAPEGMQNKFSSIKDLLASVTQPHGSGQTTRWPTNKRDYDAKDVSSSVTQPHVMDTNSGQVQRWPPKKRDYDAMDERQETDASNSKKTVPPPGMKPE